MTILSNIQCNINCLLYCVVLFFILVPIRITASDFCFAKAYGPTISAVESFFIGCMDEVIFKIFDHILLSDTG